MHHFPVYRHSPRRSLTMLFCIDNVFAYRVVVINFAQLQCPRLLSSTPDTKRGTLKAETCGYFLGTCQKGLHGLPTTMSGQGTGTQQSVDLCTLTPPLPPFPGPGISLLSSQSCQSTCISVSCLLSHPPFLTPLPVF